MRVFLAAVSLAVVAGCAQTRMAERGGEVVMVDAASIIPSLAVDMRYAGNENFVGRPIDGYEAPVCWLASRATDALDAVQKRLKPFGLGLKVFDCYRPARAVADFVAWAKDLSDQKRKALQYPNVDKARLFELGYIAEKSGHSRGSTVDLTIVDLATGAEIDMGGAYDLFDTVSWHSDVTVSAAARANRMLLQELMMDAGFRPLKEEWWHFTLNGEQYPETYFDIPIRSVR